MYLLLMNDDCIKECFWKKEPQGKSHKIFLPLFIIDYPFFFFFGRGAVDKPVEVHQNEEFAGILE